MLPHVTHSEFQIINLGQQEVPAYSAPSSPPPPPKKNSISTVTGANIFVRLCHYRQELIKSFACSEANTPALNSKLIWRHEADPCVHVLLGLRATVIAAGSRFTVKGLHYPVRQSHSIKAWHRCHNVGSRCCWLSMHPPNLLRRLQKQRPEQKPLKCASHSRIFPASLYAQCFSICCTSNRITQQRETSCLCLESIVKLSL